MEESGERVVDEGLRAIDKRTGKYVNVIKRTIDDSLFPIVKYLSYRYIGTIVGRRIGEDGYRKDCGKDIKITQCLEIRKDKNTTPIKKSNCLTTVMKDNVISSLPPGRYPNAFDMKDKFRYLTPVEMCRLQTLPDDYLDGIAPNTAMSLAGNGWTVDVIAHLLRSIERKQINDIVKEFRKITDELMFGSLETDIM